MRLLGCSRFPGNADFDTAHRMFSASCVPLPFHLSSIVGLLGLLGQRASFYDLWRLDDVLAKDVSLNEVRKPHRRLIRDELLRWDREDLVDFFQGKLLGLADETEDHAPGDEVEPSVETESSSCSHDGLHSRECQAKDTSKSVVDAHPRPFLALAEW